MRQLTLWWTVPRDLIADEGVGRHRSVAIYDAQANSRHWLAAALRHAIGSDMRGHPPASMLAQHAANLVVVREVGNRRRLQLEAYRLGAVVVQPELVEQGAAPQHLAARQSRCNVPWSPGSSLPGWSDER
jgi:predicted Fe-Mo cluster-binding NifX family protein